MLSVCLCCCSAAARLSVLPLSLPSYCSTFIHSKEMIPTMTTSSILYRPLVTASLRADANRRIRSIGRRHLATFHQNSIPSSDQHAATSSDTSGGCLCEPATKLKFILEQYRKDNFSRETPNRFKKELVRSVCSHPDATEIDVDGINHLLSRIGYGHEMLSMDDQDTLLDDINGHHAMRTLPVEDLMRLI